MKLEEQEWAKENLLKSYFSKEKNEDIASQLNKQELKEQLTILVKKLKYDILKRLLEMKDSDEEYEVWMSELEKTREDWQIASTSEFDHPLEHSDLINKCLYVSLS